MPTYEDLISKDSDRERERERERESEFCRLEPGRVSIPQCVHLVPGKK